MKTITLAVAGSACALALGLPPAAAAPAPEPLEGSIEAGLDFTAFCHMSVACPPFFAAGCPDALVEPDGAAASIVDVSGRGGQRLTFSYTDAQTEFYDDHYDEHQVSQANLTPLSGQVFFYFAGSCTVPQWFDFVLSPTPANRSYAYTIPHGAKWLVVRSNTGTADLHWSAR